MNGEPFLRIVLDSARPEQKLGAVTLSEMAKANLEECLAMAFAGLEELHDEVGASDAQRALNRAKVQAFVTELCSRSVEKIKLRLQGMEPVH